MNPSFEWELDGWTFTHSGSWATDWGYDESNNNLLRLVGSVSGANDVSAWSGFAPVDAGKRYGARITARFNAASSINSVKLRIEWFDASGQIATTTGSAAIGNPQGTASVSADAPAGATRARLRVFAVGTGTGTSTLDANLDSAMLVEGAVPSKYHQTPLPANLLAAMNPSFGWDLDGWSFTHSASPTEAWHYDDANYKAVHVTGSVAGANDVSAHSSLVAVTAGRVYSARMTARFLSGSSINSFKLRIEWFNASGNFADSTGGPAAGTEATASVTATAPGRCDARTASRVWRRDGQRHEHARCLPRRCDGRRGGRSEQGLPLRPAAQLAVALQPKLRKRPRPLELDPHVAIRQRLELRGHEVGIPNRRGH